MDKFKTTLGIATIYAAAATLGPYHHNENHEVHPMPIGAMTVMVSTGTTSYVAISGAPAFQEIIFATEVPDTMGDEAIKLPIPPSVVASDIIES